MKFNNVVQQTKDYSCGAAALSTILTYYFGRETKEAEVLEYILNTSDTSKKTKIEKKGLSLLDLKEYAEFLGYEGGGYRVPVDVLSSLARPAIALINVKDYSHFVVLKGAVRGKVYVADPARGNMSYPVDEFTDIWNGIILVFSNPSEETIESHPLTAKMHLQGTHKYKLMETLVPMSFAIAPSDF